ncbi:MAG: transcription termination/antitermination NusG family protein [Thermoanaerobaculia bacterium]
MPLLKREPDLFPSDFFELSEDTYQWWVAHVASRQEKVLARFLHDRAIPFYLPQAEKQTRRNGRTLTSHIPLFPGYVFLRADRAQRALAFRSNVIANMLEVIDAAAFAAELRQIFDLQSRGAMLAPFADLVPGDAVRITDGVFKGYSGVIVRERGDVRLVVSVSLIRQSVLVELSRDGVAPAKIHAVAQKRAS